MPAPEQPGVSPPLFIHGPSGTGKSGVTRGVLELLSLPCAIIDCMACCSPRLVFETALNQLHGHQPCAANGYVGWSPCDSIASFVAGLQEAIAARGRVCLLFEMAGELAQVANPCTAAVNVCHIPQPTPVVR